MVHVQRRYGSLKFTQLQLLVALGETGGLRRAAEALDMAQPVATRILRDLEHRLGVVLFDRSRRGMAPTFYGSAMIRHATLMLADMERAQGDIESLARGASGRLRVGSVISIAPLLLPRAVALTKARAPGLGISVLEATHELMIEKLVSGDVDVLLARRLPAHGDGDLDYDLLFREEPRVVSGPRHRLARARRLSFDQLVDETWILPPESIPLRQQLDALFVEKTGRRPTNVIESVSIATNQTLLLEAPIIGTFPVATAEYYARQGLVRILPIRLDPIRQPIALIRRKTQVRWPALDLFIEAAHETAREIQAGRARTATPSVDGRARLPFNAAR
jgi:DNA-binding transcriptional LysR family regulator